MKLFSKENKKLNYRVMNGTVSKYLSGYIVILSLITFFELFMIGRGLVLFDLSKPRHLLYFCSYFFLLIWCAEGLRITLKARKTGVIKNTASTFMNLYCVAIVLWSTLVSALDIVGNGTFIVYQTVVMGCAAMAIIAPQLYVTTVAVTALFLGIFAFYIKSALVTETGYIVNFAVLVIISIEVNLRQFITFKSEFVARDRLQIISYFDELTGIRNRRSLDEYMGKGLCSRSFGIIDLDNFKKVNDNYGHDYGDECLKAVAEYLSREFGETVFRYGGDEFIAVTEKDGLSIVGAIDAVNESLKQTFPRGDIQISAGFCTGEAACYSYEDCFKKADAALYDAKLAGRGRVIIN